MAESAPKILAAVEDAYGLPAGAISEWGAEVAAFVALYATEDEKQKIRDVAISRDEGSA